MASFNTHGIKEIKSKALRNVGFTLPQPLIPLPLQCKHNPGDNKQASKPEGKAVYVTYGINLRASNKQVYYSQMRVI